MNSPWCGESASASAWSCSVPPTLDAAEDRVVAERSLQEIQADCQRLESLIELLDRDDGYEIPPLDFSLPPSFLLSIVIPVFNEERWIETVLRRVSALAIPKEVIVVDDCSTDRTPGILRRLQTASDLRVLYKERNEGKGAALRTGFAVARGDVIVVQDADLEYDPVDIPALLRPLIENQADAVFGSRFLGDTPRDPSPIHRLGNYLLTSASNRLTGLALTDMETCYKAFRRGALQSIELRQNRFGFEPEITAKLARYGFRIAEVPVRYAPRRYQDGKKIGLRDLGNALYCIVRYSWGD